MNTMRITFALYDNNRFGNLYSLNDTASASHSDFITLPSDFSDGRICCLLKPNERHEHKNKGGNDPESGLPPLIMHLALGPTLAEFLSHSL